MTPHVIYARKSSESEDRQILSTDSQIEELRSYAQSSNFQVEEVLTEAQSAKAPGRPVFGQLISRLSERQPVSIVCWKLDRLARNPVDGAALIWAMEQRRLESIITPQRTFCNTGNDKFWMQLEFGMAKKYIDDLSDNVKRGNRAKLERGWLPGIPPIGYLNEHTTKTIIADPQRFSMVRQMWELLLAGTPVADILDRANNSWGFRTRRYQRYGGAELSRSTIYRMFANPFYYGLIERSGTAFPGAHPPMISKDEFDQVQVLLRHPRKLTKRAEFFAYSGLISCGECGAAITAERKVKPSGREYIYYHCTKRKPHTRCQQRCTRVEVLERQFEGVLERIALDERFHVWSYSEIKNTKSREDHKSEEARLSAEQSLRSFDKHLDMLTDLRLRNLISDGEFSAKRKRLVAKKLNLQQQVKQKSRLARSWLEPLQRCISFATLATREFPIADNALKREIVVAVGSNYRLRDGKLDVSLREPFNLITNTSAPPKWQATLDKLRTFFLNHPNHSIQWPEFCCSTKKSK